MTLELKEYNLKEEHFDPFVKELEELIRFNTILLKRLSHLLQLIPKKDKKEKEERDKILKLYHFAQRSDSVIIKSPARKKIIEYVPDWGLSEVKSIMNDIKNQILLRIDTQ